MKILDLPLKKEWYNMIETNIKTEEYREVKPYWIKRILRTINIEYTHYIAVDNECAEFYTNNIELLRIDLEAGGFHKKVSHVRFSYGYTKRTMLREIESITIGYGKPEWGAPTDKQVFIIKLKPLCCPSTNC